ncbi:MAG: class I SAM-dependent methyltransferase [Anaerolineaceae bacterium]|nr:class I SAM-dependent methyltransferase [Anaerolineaceae bacterium]
MHALSALAAALNARAALLDAPHHTALRLLNGFYEGCPELVIDLYGTTLLLFDYADSPQPERIGTALALLREHLPWAQAAVVKTRAGSPEARRGVLAFGQAPERKICEHGVWYALDLQMNQDAGFYLDTRGLRGWLKSNSTGLRVLNTFAYTGSLGVAALAGGAQRVLQTDLDRRFMRLAQQSCRLNGLSCSDRDFLAGDFFSVASRLRNSKQRFDLIILDPPFFSTTQRGRVDQLNQSARLINKVRPLSEDGGRIVAVNNALFLSGADYLRSLEALCQGGYMEVEELIPVPQDVTGYPATIQTVAPADPAPFNHPTKIAMLRVRHHPA